MKAEKIRLSTGKAALIVFTALLIMLASVSRSGAQTLSVDLGKMAEQLEIRYRMAEKGELPSQYILLDDAFIFPNFLKTDFSGKNEYIEFDPITGYRFKFRVPSLYGFVSRQRQEGPYFVRSQRDMREDGMEIEISSFEDLSESARRRSFDKLWLDELQFSLKKERKPGRRRGLLDLDIPINLPSQIEWLIGKGEETHLMVQGKEEITIGGTSRWCANCPEVAGSAKQQKFPDLDMEQNLTVNLHGNIGEKIIVAIDHSSHGGMGSVNKVRVNYQGFDDDVIKLIEIGDTDLTLKGTQLVKPGASKGLFGAKVMGQVGPLDLTVIAAKEEGETSSGSYSGQGGRSEEITVGDYDFIKRQYFYLENPGDDFINLLPGFPASGNPSYFPVPGEEYYLELFKSIRPDVEWADDRPKYYVKAYTDSLNNGLADDIATQEPYEFWYVLLEEGVDYDLIRYYTGEPGEEIKYLGIKLNTPLPEDKALAVRYVNDQGVTIGDYGNFPGISAEDPPAVEDLTEQQKITAELICPLNQDFYPPGYEGGRYTSTWNMMMRNVYSIGSFGSGQLEINIEDITISGEADPTLEPLTKVNFLRIFGLDMYDNTKYPPAPPPDGIIDDRLGVLDRDNGIIMFPWYEPFNPPLDVTAYNLNPVESDYATATQIADTLEMNDAIYGLKTWSTNPPHRFNLVIRSEGGPSTFKLDHFDIIEGSVSVAVDGNRLSEGSDYDVDYAAGEVRLKGDAAMSVTSESNVSIDYQHTPLVGGGKTSLLGVGADLNLSTNTRFSGTFLYNSVGAPRYSPRLGEEPSRTMASDINGSVLFRPRWMTSVANLLPRVDTNSESSLELSGEVAVSIPNPNVKGEAYVDDMEGVEDSNQIGLTMRSWYEASPPLDPEVEGQTLDPVPADLEFFWYNPNAEGQQKDIVVNKQDMNPRLDERERIRVNSLFMKAINPEPGQWCGVMTGFPGGLDIQTAQYLEIWVNDFNTDPETRGGILHVDLGKIDEDFYQPELDILNDEKQINWNAVEYDIGFPGDNPSRLYPLKLNDDYWNPTWQVYEWINSRISNNYHDTEDLNRSGFLDKRNEYYSLTLNLADSALIDVWRDFQSITGYWYPSDDVQQGEINRQKRWRMYRLDLSKALVPGGIAPRLDEVQHMRIWIENVDELKGVTKSGEPSQHVLAIGGIKFVGSRWEYDNIRDLKGEIIHPVPGSGTVDEMNVTVGAVNNKDNPTLYFSPYRVEDEEGIENREQSLLFDVENFADSSAFKVIKRFYGRGQDFQQYREMIFFIRGDDELVSYGNDKVDFYLQIARDSSNYYELEVPLTSRDIGKWIQVKVTLADLTNMKIGFSGTGTVEKVITDAVDPKRFYTARLKGTPTLFEVKYLFAGLRNRSGGMIPRGQLWFDDLGLGEVRKDIDHAERISLSARFANILTVVGEWQHSGPDFRKLHQSRGSGNATDNLVFRGNSEINHFVPTGGFTLPVSASYSTMTSRPKYMTNSDIEIENETVRDSMETVSNKYNFNITMRRSGSSNFIMKNLFDNLNAGYKVAWSKMHSPNSADTSRTMEWNVNYQIRFNKKRELSLPRGIKWRYWLTSFSLDAKGKRYWRRVYSYSSGDFLKKPTSKTHNWSDKMQMIYDPFDFLNIRYDRDENRDLLLYREFHGMPTGSLTGFNENIRFDFKPGQNFFLISEFKPTIDYTARYHEDGRPAIRVGDDPQGTRTIDASRSVNFSFDVDVGKYTVKTGKFIGILPKSETAKRRAGTRRSPFTETTTKFVADTFKKPDSFGGEQKTKGIDELNASNKIKNVPTKPPTAPAVTPADTTGQSSKGAYADLGTRKPRGPAISRKTVEDEGEGSVEEPGAPADTLQSKPRDPRLLLRHLFHFMGGIEPVRSTLNLDQNNSYDRVYDRADIMYRLGITNRSGVIGPSGEIENEPRYSSKSLKLIMRTGFDLTSNISADLRSSIGTSTTEKVGTKSKTNNITWPDVTVNWQGLEKWSLIKRFIKTSYLTISFKQTKITSLGREQSSFNLTPNWNLTWKNDLSTALSLSYNQSSDVNRSQDMWKRNWSANVELRYNIKGSKGFGLPLPFLNKKKLKFKSELNTVMNINYSVTESYNVPAVSSLGISPSMSYRFSESVNGNLTLRYSRTAGGIMNTVNHEVGMHATASFKF